MNTLESSFGNASSTIIHWWERAYSAPFSKALSETSLPPASYRNLHLIFWLPLLSRYPSFDCNSNSVCFCLIGRKDWDFCLIFSMPTRLCLLSSLLLPTTLRCLAFSVVLQLTRIAESCVRLPYHKILLFNSRYYGCVKCIATFRCIPFSWAHRRAW